MPSNLPIDGHNFRRVEVLTGTPRRRPLDFSASLDPCVPRMKLNLEVQVLFGPQGAEPRAKGNCVAVMRGGEEAGGKTGADEQKADTRPVRWGNPAWDGDTQCSFC
jgi:hypothetical protein